MAADVTIIIPNKNTPTLARTLSSLGEQRAAFTHDVIVVDSSTGEDRDRVRVACAEAGARLIQEPLTVSQALHRGVAEATAPVVVTLPADAVPREGWLRALTRPVRRGRWAWAAGPAHGGGDRRTPTWHYFHARTASFYGAMTNGQLLPSGLAGWNTAYARQSLLLVGNFDSDLISSEDWDLHLRLNQAGHLGVYVAAAGIDHDHPATLRELYRRERWYKRGQVRVMRKHGIRHTFGPLLTPLFYLGLALSLALWLLHPFGWVPAAGVYGLLWVKQTAGAIAQRDPYFLVRPLLRTVEAVAGIEAMAREILRSRPRD